MIQFHRESNNCFQDVLAMILRNNGKDPFLIYQGSLNFGYNQSGEIYGDRITPSRDGNWLDNSLISNLYEFSNTILYLKETVDVKELFGDILSRREQEVILKVDIYDCEWHPFFKKYHTEHYCWIVGHDEVFLKCALPYGQRWGYYPIKNLYKMEKITYYTCALGKKKEDFNVIDTVIKTFHECEKGWDDISDICQMVTMRSDIMESGINLKREREGYSDVFAIPVIRAFEWITWSRMNYRDYLTQENQNGIVDNLIVSVDKATHTWSGIKNYVIRDIVRGNDEITQEFIKYLDRVIYEERQILEEMRRIEDNRNEM